MKGRLWMSEKERTRKSFLDRVMEGEMTLVEASHRLRLSYRQCRRDYKRFREQGDVGLVHRSRGRRSNRGKPVAFREAVVQRYRERYEGFGPTLASEKLEEDGYRLDHETLRRWLKVEGLWTKKRKRTQHRSWREPRAPRSEADFHRPLPKGLDLREVFCFEQTRTVANDWTVQYQNRVFQVHKKNRLLPRPREKVTVRSLLDGTIQWVYQGRKLQFAEVESASDGPRPKARPRRSPAAQKETPLANKRSQYKPPPDHPWRRPWK